MSKRTPGPRECLDLFSLADLPEHARPENEELKYAPPTADPSRKTRKKTTPPIPLEEASNDRFLRDFEVGQRYGVCRQTVWRWAENGKLPEPIRFSQGVTRWRLSDLLALETSLLKGVKGNAVRPRRVKTAKAEGQP